MRQLDAICQAWQAEKSDIVTIRSCMDIHHCSNCHSENRAEARFCKRCGLWLLPNCPFCNTRLPEAALFCDQCGRQLNPQIVSTPPILDPRLSSPSVTLHSHQIPPPTSSSLKESKRL